MSAETYATDLAWIHHAGFSEFAESAAAGIITMLARRGVTAGTVVDAGCGSGILARALGSAAFRVVAFDASLPMILLARSTAPRASLFVARFTNVAIPRCDAITAVGEVLNYGTFEHVERFVSSAAHALPRGGVLLFDVAERGSYPPHDEVRRGGEDWSVIAIKESDGTHLSRRVLTFRQIDGEVRRSEELHTLTLYDRAALSRCLRAAGFTVETRRSYGTRRLPPAHAVYVAVKAAS